MKKSFSGFAATVVTVLGLASLVVAPDAGAAGERRGGGGGGGGGGGNARAETNRQPAQVNNTKADARTNNVRSTSVNNVNNNNVNVNRNVNVNTNNGWNNDYHHHPVATAAAIAGTAAIIGSMVRTVPAGCAPVNYGGVVYQQCAGTWYAPQGSQFVVVSPPY
jgi:hypothetical protein